MSLLFSPFTLKNVTLKNRVVMLPHVTFYATADRWPSARLKNYYLERAKGGVGLIISESQFVHPSGGCDYCVDASSLAGMREWQDGIATIHSYGTKIFAQLTHHGLETLTIFTRQAQWGPSAVANPAVRETPKVMDKRDIETVIAAFAAAAAHVREVGFDGVELKVGHDGLLRTFLSPFYNRRQDEYGGSLENRARLVLEVLAAVRRAVGDDYPVGFRFCLDEAFPGGYTLDDALAYARLFAATGQLDYLSGDMGTWISVEKQVPPMVIPQGFALEACAAAKQATGLPVIAFGRIKQPAQAEQILAQGQADLVGMARQLLCDPAWVDKVERGRTADIRPCVACNQECVGRLQRNLPIACVHNPAAGYEAEWGMGTLTPSASPKKVIVVGGGPMGLQAAATAAARGHHVTLIEAQAELGGQVNLAAQAPHHAEWGQIATHLAHEVARLGVNVCLNQHATADTILAQQPDVVIIATGSRPGPPPFPVQGELPLVDEWQVMRGQGPAGKKVMLFDLGVKFEAAALAETLAARGNQVQWVTPAFVVGEQIDPTSIGPLRQRLAQHGVVCTPEHTILEVNDGLVLLFNILSHQVMPVPGIEAIVIAGNKTANAELARQLDGKVELYVGGDAAAPRTVYNAIVEGERMGRMV